MEKNERLKDAPKRAGGKSKAGSNEDEDDEKAPESWVDSDGEDLTTLDPEHRCTPPSHVTANGLYSNSYRAALGKGLELAAAKRRARYACQFFKAWEWVPQKYVGQFRSQKRRS